MSKAWIEDLWLTEPRETLPDGSKVKIPVPSSVTKSLAAYMKTPEKAKVPGKFKTARYGHGKRWRVVFRQVGVSCLVMYFFRV